MPHAELDRYTPSSFTRTSVRVFFINSPYGGKGSDAEPVGGIEGMRGQLPR
jgi:hypothetical protein